MRVEERDGLRLLTLDGVVQGARPLGNVDVAATADPLVKLVRTARPNARTALLIGLGTGQTATALAAEGFDVEVVEQEPAVIDLARRFFGFDRPVVTADGLDHMDRSRKAYDVVVVDTATAKTPPTRFLSNEALSTLGLRPGSATLIAARWQGRPFELNGVVPRLIGKDHDVLTFSQMLGSGMGDEEQNLYLLASVAPVNLVRAGGIAAWPIPSERVPAHARPTATSVARSPASRHVMLVGYVVLGRDGEVFLDLPHYEMGAVRYRLSGEGIAALATLVPKGELAHTDGDIGTDGDTSKTLRELLGGGGVKRSDVRFSSVVAEVEGIATLASLVSPDATRGALPAGQDQGAIDPRLPWGGALYDLAVLKILFTVERPRWMKQRAQLAPIFEGAAHALEARDLKTAERALGEYAAMLSADLGPAAEHVEALVEVRRGRQGLEHEVAEAGASASASVACARVRRDVASVPAYLSDARRRLLAALARCVGGAGSTPLR